MNILIYEENLNGHRLEYLHHLYMLAYEMKEHTFVFALSDRFYRIKDMFQWPSSANIIINTFPDKEIQPNGRKGLLENLKHAKEYAGIINQLVKGYNIERIFAIDIIHYLPFTPLFLKGNATVDGVLYKTFPSKGKISN